MSPLVTIKLPQLFPTSVSSCLFHCPLHHHDPLQRQCSMTTPHPAKRRRIDEISSVNKPFRSPLKGAGAPRAVAKPPPKPSQLSKPEDDKAPTNDGLSTSVLPSPSPTQAPTVALEYTSPEIPDSDASAPASPLHLTPRSSHPVIPPTSPLAQAKLPPPSPTTSDLQSQIALLRTHPALTSSDQATALHRLTDKWLLAARAAAELLYPRFQDRPIRSRNEGGGRGRDGREEYEELLRQTKNMLDNGVDEAGDPLGRAEREGLKDRVGWLRELVEEGEDDGENEGEDMTLGGMLKRLGIDFGLVDWDEKEGCWRD
ncbi:hypothetical protein ANO11243_011010 [Dothideomycetidae sp. 11243]|nr:hypothetical protein ANO11243_011010 [fungal sp. No.11243]